MSELEPYLVPGVFIDSDDADVRAFAARRAAGADGALARAGRLYYAVRDEIPYDPYYVGADRAYFRASDCLRAGRGFCIPKAALLAAAARALGVPARVGYADVRNHLTTKRLAELVGGDLYVWHGYTELHLEGSWVKATPAFNLSLCERFGVRLYEAIGSDGPVTLLTDGRDVYARTAAGEFYNLLQNPDQPLLVIGGESSFRELSARARSGKRKRKKKGPKA